MSDVNPSVLEWAINRCELTPQDLKAAFPKIDQWLDGTAQPTTKQLIKFADRTHVLVPQLYADTPPNLGLQITDFRKQNPRDNAVPSPELYDTINQMLSRKDWLRGYLESCNAERIPFVGKLSGSRDTMRCAEEIRFILDLDEDWPQSVRAEESVRVLRRAIESKGVCTQFGSYVGNSNQRKLKVSEFRGFVLADPYAPLIFVNSADAKPAQLFTLLHEFAHLLLNQTGLDGNAYEAMLPNIGQEDLCNAAAAEVLMPASLVYRAFDTNIGSDPIVHMMNLTKASEPACLRRAHELGCITYDEYVRRYQSYQARWMHSDKKKQDQDGGDSGHTTYYPYQKFRLGALFPENVYIALKSEYLLYSDAYDLMGMKAKTFKEFFRREGLAV